MAKANKNSDDLLMANESPLAKAQAKRYVDNQTRSDFYKNISSYMFWGATSIMLGLGYAAFASTGGLAALGWMLYGGVAASAATFIGSVVFSRKATEISEKSQVLYSDIDSQNQARRMVQAFAKAQNQDKAPEAAAEQTPMTSSGRSWADRVGGPSASGETWQAKVAAQAAREDAVALENVR